MSETSNRALRVPHRRRHLTIDVKRVDAEQRIIEGVASSGATDRMGDELDPAGAVYSTPLPLLWGHDPRAAVGHVEQVTLKGNALHIRARLAKIAEPGTLKDLLDHAWQSVRAGLVSALSVGFRQLAKPERIATGFRFTEWEMLEVSLVSIPANSEAVITAAKAGKVTTPAKPTPLKTMWRRGEICVVGTTKYRALRDVSLPPWKAGLSWRLVA